MTASQMLHFPSVAVECGIVLAATQLLTRHGMAHWHCFSHKKIYHAKLLAFKGWAEKWMGQ